MSHFSSWTSVGERIAASFGKGRPVSPQYPDPFLSVPELQHYGGVCQVFVHSLEKGDVGIDLFGEAFCTCCGLTAIAALFMADLRK